MSKSQGTNPIAQSAPETKLPPPEPSRTERLSFWERLTRRVIRDLIGIDDATLEYLFGESLPEEPPKPTASAASAIVDFAENTILDDEPTASETSSWDQKLLGRIAKELGILFNHISDHPGAFSTYLRTQEMPPYAGLPNPETRSHASRPLPSRRTSNEQSPTATDALLTPTMPHQHHRRHSVMTMDPSLWGIEEEEEEARPPSASVEAARLKREKDYWEQDLDVKMVFGFLRNRLTSSSSSSTTSSTPAVPAHSSSMSAQATTTAPQQQTDSLRRAALIRHHHPLVSRTSTTPSQPIRRSSGTSNILASGAPLSPILGRRSNRGADTESCASQSTKRSRTGRSGSSRNYWDLGGLSDGISPGDLGGSVSWGQV